MSGNIANGGLLVKWRDSVVFAKPSEFFLNADEEYIYYSDRSYGNRLYKKCGSNDVGKVILKKPCSGLRLFEDGLYYVNEDDNRVYRCSKEGRNETCFRKEETVEFCILDDGSIYAPSNARRLCLCGDKAYFADADSDFSLASAYTKNNEKQAYPTSKPSYINACDGDIYFVDRAQGNKIFRLGGKFSVFGESAACLHVIDDWLYFYANRVWKRLSLIHFGEAEDI